MIDAEVEEISGAIYHFLFNLNLSKICISIF